HSLPSSTAFPCTTRFRSRRGFTRNLPFGILIALVLLAEIGVAVSAWSAGPTLSGSHIPATNIPNIVALGQLLYSRYLFPFEIARSEEHTSELQSPYDLVC